MKHAWQGLVRAVVWDLGEFMPASETMIEIKRIVADHFALAVVDAVSSCTAQLRHQHGEHGFEIVEIRLIRADQLSGGSDGTPAVEHPPESRPRPAADAGGPGGGDADRS